VFEPAAREIDLRVEGSRAVPDEEVARIDAASQSHDVEIEIEREESVQRLARGLRAGFVAVEHERRPAGSGSADQGSVILGGGRPEDRDDVLDAVLVRRHHVRVSLDEDDAFSADRGRARSRA
jgi:hypothetical protein